MAAKTVRFIVEVKNLTITAANYEILGAADGHAGSAIHRTPFLGNSFQVEIAEGTSEYFAVTIFVQAYSIGGTEYSSHEKPIALLATFHLPSADLVTICPESSIASVYTFARMLTVADDGLVVVIGSERSMKIAYGMKQNIFRTEGGVADMIRQSPNGFETNSYPMLNSLCNLFYYCLTNPTTGTGKPFYDQFLDYAWHEADKPNTTFLGAVRAMLHDPFTNAGAIYGMLAGQAEVYADSLTSMDVTDAEKVPTQWTLTLKSNSSGARNFIPAGTAFAVFDADDNVWVANNFRAGSGTSGTHGLVYRYDATPASFSPVQGGGLLGVGFGVAIDPSRQFISFGNFGWGPELNNPQEGSISRFFYKDGTPVSPSNGYTPGLSRVQGMNYDAAGNLWMASVGCQDPFAPGPDGVYPFESAPSAVVVYLQGDPANMLKCDEFPVKRSADADAVPLRTPYLKVFDVVPDNQGNAYVSCIGNYDRKVAENCALSAVYKVALDGQNIVVKASWYSDYASPINKQTGFESLRQLAINGDGDVVVVGVAGSRATVLSRDLEFKGYYDTNTFAPWGIKIDGKQTVFLANFGQETGDVRDGTLDLQAPFGVTMLRNPADPASARLLTLPTGGSEVMLANGHPLYGAQTEPGAPGSRHEAVRLKSYQPIMRLTSTNIDGAGNLWCMNNWKPSPLIDVKDNPGGDGVVIFLGIAEPE